MLFGDNFIQFFKLNKFPLTFDICLKPKQNKGKYFFKDVIFLQ